MNRLMKLEGTSRWLVVSGGDRWRENRLLEVETNGTHDVLVW